MTQSGANGKIPAGDHEVLTVFGSSFWKESDEPDLQF